VEVPIASRNPAKNLGKKTTKETSPVAGM